MKQNDGHARIWPIRLDAIFLMFLVGCSSGTPQIKLYRISGTITQNGQPVPGLLIYFVPDKGRISTGLSDPDGRFTLGYQKDSLGAVPGEHKVWVKYLPKSPEEEQQLRTGKLSLPTELAQAIEKYGSAQTSPLSITVDGDRRDLVISLD